MLQNSNLKLILVSIIFTSLIGCKEKTEPTKNETTTLNNSFDLDFSKSKVYTTTAGNDVKLQLTSEKIEFSDFGQPLETQASILVNPSKEHQTFVGIGAALTDASAENFYKLNKGQQKLFMEAYYSLDKGIGYSLGRTIIHSCDFSPYSYTYVEEGDKDLNTFNIDHE